MDKNQKVKQNDKNTEVLERIHGELMTKNP